MSPYLVFNVDTGVPSQQNAKLYSDEETALAYALNLCERCGINLEEQQNDLEIEEWDIDYFEIGIGYGKQTVFGYYSQTVYIWEMTVV